MSEYQRNLEELKEELYSGKMSRREFLALSTTKAAGLAAGAFLAGGVVGYLMGRKEEAHKTTETLTKTEVDTKTVTKTEKETIYLTKTETKTKTVEKPNIIIQTSLEKSYDRLHNDIKIELRVKKLAPQEPIDWGVKGFFTNARKKEKLYFYRDSDAYVASVLTEREPGDQLMEIEVESGKWIVKKELSVEVGLSENEIKNSCVEKEGIRMLWEDILKSDYEKDVGFLEKLLRVETDIVNLSGIKEVSKIHSLYLLELSYYIYQTKEDYLPIIDGLSALLKVLSSKPWIYCGNFTSDLSKMEYPLKGEATYLLPRFISEVKMEEDYFYAARAMIDQVVDFCKINWEGRITPFTVVEYKGKRLQPWDLAKQIFNKHLKYEAEGKRASTKDLDVLREWGDRSGINNNRHIYYGLRQVELPEASCTTDFFCDINESAWPLQGKPIEERIPMSLDIMSKYLERYEINEELWKIINNPDKPLVQCPFPPHTVKSVIQYLDETTSSREWREHWPNSMRESREDTFKILLFKGSPISRIPIMLQSISNIWTRRPEESRVETGICLGSYLGIPNYRCIVGYPLNTPIGREGVKYHGDRAFVLIERDEKLLYERSTEELLLEKDYTYSLPIFWTRKQAYLKDEEEKGETEDPVFKYSIARWVTIKL